MENRDEVKEFLRTRRARVRPEEVGLPAGANRRVPGLRRGEVAMLAGVSIEYYSRIERGQLAGASASVLDSIARALRLDDAERSHLFALAQASDGTNALLRRGRRRSTAWQPRPSLQWMLDAFTEGAAFVRNGRMDVLATNSLGRAFLDGLYRSTTNAGRIPNFAKYTFLDPGAAEHYLDWSSVADITVAILRTTAGRDPHDPALHDLVGELSTCSDQFRQRWGAHDVRLHGSGIKNFHHEAVGDLELHYEGLELASDPGLVLTLYRAEPASPSDHRMKLLASWWATEQQNLPRGATHDQAPAG